MARPGRWVRFAIGVAVSVVALAILLARIPPREIALRLASVRPAWVAGMIGVRILLLWGKERRWLAVIAAMVPQPIAAAWRATAAGYFGNFALPMRLGEALRAGILRAANPELGLADIAATIGTERLLDASVLAAMVLPVLPHVVAPAWLRGSAGLLAGLLFAVTLLAAASPLHPAWARRLPLGGARGFVLRAMEVASRGTRVLRRSRHLALAVAITIAIWLGEALVMWLGARSLGCALAYPAALLVTLLYAFGSLVPSAPAQIGTHQAMAVIFLAPFGIDQATAFSLSLTLQAVNLIVLGALGGPALALGFTSQRGAATATISAARSGSSRPSSS